MYFSNLPETFRGTMLGKGYQPSKNFNILSPSHTHRVMKADASLLIFLTRFAIRTVPFIQHLPRDFSANSEMAMLFEH